MGEEWFESCGVGWLVPAGEGGSDEAVVWVVIWDEDDVFDGFSL